MLTLTLLCTIALGASGWLALFLSPFLLYRSNRLPKDRQEYYRDEDGSATGPAQLSFDRKQRINVFGLLLWNSLGFVVNVCAISYVKDQPQKAFASENIVDDSIKAFATVSKQACPFDIWLH